MTKSECIFCKIASGEIAADFVHRDSYCVAVNDIAPAAPVHVLVIPVEHFTYLEHLTSDFSPVLFRMFEVARDVAYSAGISESGYRLVINQKYDSGQEVPHLHLHILGGNQLGSMV